MLIVLRLNHRKERDKRLTSHVFLCARALGADKGVLCGENDANVINSVNKVSENWGGSFKISWSASPKKTISQSGAKIVHLTMYGQPLSRVMPKIRKHKKVMVVVGSSKVQPEFYELADYNVSVTNQPHSEVSSLALFLDRYFRGRELEKKFKNAKIKVNPSKKGKDVVKK